MNTRILAALAATLLAVGAAGADEARRFAADDPTWRAECGSCHVAYPPSLLGAASWRAVMAGLDRHFGVDASLDPIAAARIGAFLERNASTRRSAADGKPPLRITETRWFVHEHDEIPAATWKRPAVKGPANCAACHAGADRGNFDEHAIRIPK